MNPIVKEFLLESNENLSLINEEMTKFEKNPDDKDLLNSIYRTIHTIKGSSGFLGFSVLEKLTHAVENELDKIREGTLDLSGELVDIFLESFDLCQIIIRNIENTEAEGDVDISSPLKKLEDYNPMSSGDGTNANPASEEKNTEVQFEEIDKILDDEFVSNNVNVDYPEVKAPAQESAPSKEAEVAAKVETSAEPAKIEEAKVVEAPAASKPAPGNPEPVAKKVDSAPKVNINDSVRVNVALLDKILNMVGELVLNRNQILQFAKMNEEPELNRLSHQLNVITTELQTDIMTTRMQPVGTVFSKFDRVVRDLARGQKKKILVDIQGQETELDKTLLEVIKDPLTHLVRNAADHGIENPDDRLAKGKTEEGHLSIKAYHEGGQVVIEISDDGNGVNTKKVLAKAIQKGLVTQEESETISDQKICNMIFHPGFSTAEKVTNISGRGVGMDVVKSNIEKIGGQVEVHSRFGQGTTFKLKIPLTLAIVPALVVDSGGETFAIPQKNLVELVLFEEDDFDNIEKLYDQEFFRLRGELIPIFRLNSSLGITDEYSNENMLNIIVLKAEGTQYGLIVDDILDTQEIVVKPLSRRLKCKNIYAGATIMGDGRVALIVDALGYYNMVDKGNNSEVKPENDEIMSSDGSNILREDLQEILLFQLADGRPYGIPLVLVNRLEEFKISEVEYSGTQSLIRYRGSAMPLIWLNEKIGEKAVVSKDEDSIIQCLVSSAQGMNFGFVVDKILDISTTAEALDVKNVDNDSMLGTTYINERLITLFDIHKVVSGLNIGKNGKNEKRARVLLAEDSALYQKVEMGILADLNLDVVLVENGKDALEKLKSDPNFDLLVTDVEMPEMDGWELAEAVRGLEGAVSNIPILAVTTRVSDEDLEKGRKAGFSVHLEKLNKYEMMESVNQMLNL